MMKKYENKTNVIGELIKKKREEKDYQKQHYLGNWSFMPYILVQQH